jgi:hypothetical protein
MIIFKSGHLNLQVHRARQANGYVNCRRGVHVSLVYTNLYFRLCPSYFSARRHFTVTLQGQKGMRGYGGPPGFPVLDCIFFLHIKHFYVKII